MDIDLLGALRRLLRPGGRSSSLPLAPHQAARGMGRDSSARAVRADDFEVGCLTAVGHRPPCRSGTGGNSPPVPASLTSLSPDCLPNGPGQLNGVGQVRIVADGVQFVFGSAVDRGHVYFVVAFSGGRTKRVEPAQLVFGEFEPVCRSVLQDPGDPPGAGDRGNVVTSGE